MARQKNDVDRLYSYNITDVCQTQALTLGKQKADVMKRFVAQPVKYTISQYPFSLSKPHA